MPDIHSETVALVWRGGEHNFLLRLGELRALQNRCEVGIPRLIARLAGGIDWNVDDVLHTVRLGLIGGGMDERTASKLVQDTLEENRGAIFESAPLALRILQHSFIGDPHEEDEDQSSDEREDDGSKKKLTDSTFE